MTDLNENKSAKESISLEKCSSPGRKDAPISDTLAEASEYVASIMSGQMISKVDTPNANSRKRNLSVSGTSDTTTKKARGEKDDDLQLEDLTNTDRSQRKARRSLINKGSGKVPQNVVVTEADVHVSATPSVQQLFAKLSADMNMMFMSVNERLDKIDSGLEKRIATKVSQILDKRVNSEMNKIRTDFESRLVEFKESLRAEVSADLDDLRDEVKSRESTTQSTNNERDISLNIVIRNLPESHSENTKSKVNSLLRDGLRLSDISVDDAERKRSYTEGKPGVIVAKMKNKQEKTRVMKEKRRLKDSRQFSNVFIQHDLHPSQRSVSSNFRRIVQAMKSNANNLSMRGARILYDRDSQTPQGPGESVSDHPRENNFSYDYSRSDRQSDRTGRRDRDRLNGHGDEHSYGGKRRDYNSYNRDNRDISGRDFRQDRPRDGRRWRD